MNAESIIHAYYAAFNQGQWEAMLALLDDDVIHEINQGPRVKGKEAFRSFLLDMAEHYDEQLSELIVMSHPSQERAAAEFMCTGIYRKTQAQLPVARQQRYTLPVGAFFTLKNKRIVRVSNYYNLQDWLRQVEGP